MMAKPIRALEMHYPMIQFLIKTDSQQRDIAPLKMDNKVLNIRGIRWTTIIKFQSCYSDKDNFHRCSKNLKSLITYRRILVETP